MSRQKLKHIKELHEFENVFDNPSEMKGKWRSGYFKNKGEIVLEMGCAGGDYTLALATRFKNRNFLGLDKKGGRIWGGAIKALDKGMKNVGFVRCMAEKMEEYFEENEIDEIWVTFPDPFPKPSRANRRLISPRFLKIYRKILKPGGKIHLKTDNLELFDYCVNFVEAEKCLINEEIRDLHAQKNVDDILKISTFYERRFMSEGKPIYYIEFILTL